MVIFQANIDEKLTGYVLNNIILYNTSSCCDVTENQECWHLYKIISMNGSISPFIRLLVVSDLNIC